MKWNTTRKRLKSRKISSLPYSIPFDDDYEKLCPWASIVYSGREWPVELTDATVEIFASEKKPGAAKEEESAEGGKLFFQWRIVFDYKENWP